MPLALCIRPSATHLGAPPPRVPSMIPLTSYRVMAAGAYDPPFARTLLMLAYSHNRRDPDGEFHDGETGFKAEKSLKPSNGPAAGVSRDEPP